MFESHTNAELVAHLRDVLEELERRLANYVDLRAESEEAADEGLVLAARTHRLLYDALNTVFSARRDMEEVGADA